MNGLRGKAKLAERNGDDGEPTMWFWQVEGRRWNLDGGSFHTAKKAWERLAATDEQLAAENEKRYDRRRRLYILKDIREYGAKAKSSAS